MIQLISLLLMLPLLFTISIEVFKFIINMIKSKDIAGLMIISFLVGLVLLGLSK